MSRVTVALLVWVTVAVVPAVAQNRSNFDGTWRLLVPTVPEKSQPANPNDPVTSFTIAQEGQKFTIISSGALPGQSRIAKTYVADGAEHLVPESAASQAKSSTYRAAWTGDQLVMTFTTPSPSASGEQNSAQTIVTLQVYSIDVEGRLVIEASVVGASMSIHSAPSRSVYRKGS
jgi:hypothetical protein